MIHFIKLTSNVINKLHIIDIVKKQNKYYIHMSNISVNGNINGYLLAASGNLGGQLDIKRNIIEICEKNNKQDYDTITDLIKSI